jgi:acid stress-induced BolA-like protein IbaG/YrbA
MGIEQQIKDILARELPGVRVEVELNQDTGKVGGRVIWEGFAGYNSRRRQNRVFSLLRRNLNAAQAQANISYLFTYTPAEFEQTQPY